MGEQQKESKKGKKGGKSEQKQQQQQIQEEMQNSNNNDNKGKQKGVSFSPDPVEIGGLEVQQESDRSGQIPRSISWRDLHGEDLATVREYFPSEEEHRKEAVPARCCSIM